MAVKIRERYIFLKSYYGEALPSVPCRTPTPSARTARASFVW